jgi:acid phosphatase class B
MNTYARSICAVALICAAASAAAADGSTAPYNEAVKIVDGKRVVEVAPFPPSLKSFLPITKSPDESGGVSTIIYSIETPQGLMDCNGFPYYNAKVCSPSSFGKLKRQRIWAVKLNGHWQQCLGRLKPIKCIPTVQDGVLRGLPTPEEE